jgi:hypothetical protein
MTHMLAIYAVNEHIADLHAQAKAAQLARQARKARVERRGFVAPFLASLLAAVRGTRAPITPSLRAYPRA